MADDRDGVTHAPPGREPPERPARRVLAPGGRDLHRAPPGPAEPEAEVHVLGPEGRRGVEATHRIERLTTKDLTCADREVDVPRVAHTLSGRAAVEVGAVQ